MACQKEWLVNQIELAVLLRPILLLKENSEQLRDDVVAMWESFQEEKSNEPAKGKKVVQGRAVVTSHDRKVLSSNLP